MHLCPRMYQWLVPKVVRDILFDVMIHCGSPICTGVRQVSTGDAEEKEEEGSDKESDGAELSMSSTIDEGTL